ncbi:dihydrofolate reductase family protein [Variovorax sp. S2]|uniref:dihydrofolate reductase family protein n=1 Tax=Variovorax sp. S12S4 TaxID=3029170 RepID=UPI00215D0A63|nr:dihydrofolate reductase family protein [Variovorax sp. S12S4]MCR8958573.1 dihydrofolate reductase family protein [Variovorax sp. S12S4]
MAKLIVSILSSLDGYCAGPGGALASLPMDAAFSAHNLDCMRLAGTLLFGATTFPMFEAYWPNVDRGPGSEPVQREIAERVGAARKVLVSDRLVVRPDSPWADTEVVSRAQAPARIGQLKAAPGPDLLIYGSHVLYNDLLARRLVDELHLLVGSVLLGEGVPTFEPGLAQNWKLLSQNRLPGSDTVALHYDCRPQ